MVNKDAVYETTQTTLVFIVVKVMLYKYESDFVCYSFSANNSTDHHEILHRRYQEYRKGLG